MGKSMASRISAWESRSCHLPRVTKAGRKTGARGHRFLCGEALEPRAMLAVTPQMLTDLNLGQAGVRVHGPIVYLEDGFGYFSGGYGANDYELWKTDGTQPGTMLVKDINPGATGSRPSNLIDVGGTLFFTAD